MAEMEAKEIDRSTHFVFQHKVFSIDGSYFSSAGPTGVPKFHMPLGDAMASISLPALRAEFQLSENTDDGQLLGIVERSLRHVRAIRPNDSIPNEVLDGSASWSVDEKHRKIAEGRLSAQLLAWMTGSESVITDSAALERLANDPATKAKVEEAVTKLARELGLPADERQKVLGWIEHLVDELSYIEALRDYFRRLLAIATKVGDFTRSYKKDQGIFESLVRVQTLLRTPLGAYHERFVQLDGQTSEILAVLKNIEQQVEMIRACRDRLHFDFMLWDDLIERWQRLPTERSEHGEALIRETYRFLARNFQQSQDWGLGQWG